MGDKSFVYLEVDPKLIVRFVGKLARTVDDADEKQKLMLDYKHRVRNTPFLEKLFCLQIRSE